MRVAVLFGIFLAFCSPALAGPRVDHISIVDKGIYKIERGPQKRRADTPTGKVMVVETARKVKATSHIVARPGLEFGYRYIVVGKPAGANVSLDFVIRYPAPGIRAPGKTKPARQSRFSLSKKIGDTAYFGYGFENDWEIVPGIWTFQIRYENRKLAEQRFTVSK